MRGALLAAASGRRRPPPLIFDFTRQAAGYTSAVSTGLGFTRAACVDSVQTGTSTLVEIASAADVLRYGRALDAWDVGLVLEESRTNEELESRELTGSNWSAGATLDTGQPNPFGTAGGSYRVQVASGGLMRGIPQTGSSLTFTLSQWILGAAPNMNIYMQLAPRVATTAGSVGAWGRISVTGTQSSASASIAVPVDGRDWSGNGGLTAGARDCYVDGVQREGGSFPTEWIPTTGSTATRNGTLLSVLNAAWAPYVSTGRLSIELAFRAKGARTEYSGTPYFWHTFDNASAFFNPATGVLTLRDTASSTNTVTLPSWARNDLVELSVQYGGGLVTVVKYRLNSGSVVSLSVTGSALASVYTGARDLYLMNSNSAAAGQVSCWLYTARFYAANTCPAWAA